MMPAEKNHQPEKSVDVIPVSDGLAVESSPVCLNCSATVTGAYCSTCGQEHRAAKQSVWQLLGAFFSGIFNYDGRLIRSVRLLFTKPAGLTIAYMEGKRARYVNPVQFYLFTSALYFLFVNYVPVSSPAVADISAPEVTAEEVSDRIQQSLEEVLPENTQEFGGLEDSGGVGDTGERVRPGDAESTGNIESFAFTESNPKDIPHQPETALQILGMDFETYDEYLAHQSTLPETERSNYVELLVMERVFHIQSAYSDGTSIREALAREVFQRLPQLLFFTLPLLALITKMVYFRRRNLWYIDHLIFILHTATSFFLLLFAQHSLELLGVAFGQTWMASVSGLLGLGWFVYYIASFRRFFEDRWLKTAVLFSITSFWQSVVILVAFLILMVVSLFNL